MIHSTFSIKLLVYRYINLALFMSFCLFGWTQADSTEIAENEPEKASIRVSQNKEPSPLTVLESDKTLNVKVVSPSLLNWLVPSKIRHSGLYFRVENPSEDSIEIKDFSLSLKGNATQSVLTESDISWENENKTIPPGGLRMLEFKLEPEHSLDADQYNGQLRLYFEKNQPLSIPVTMFSRIGVFGAIIILLLGIVVGRMMKDVNNSQEQIELMDRFIPIRAKVDQLQGKTARNSLSEELKKLEADINKVIKEEDKAPVEKKMAILEKKVTNTEKLEVLDKLIKEFSTKPEGEGLDYSELSREVKAAQSEILAENDKAVLKHFETIQKLFADLQAPSSKGGGMGDDDDEETEAVSSELGDSIQKEIEKTLNEFKGKKTQEETDTSDYTFWQKAEVIFFRVMKLLTGIKVTARVRYGLFRPLVSLATFTVIVLIGFQEIYIKGGDTFGMEGIYDYLKLFLWGIVSDVFSRTLTGDSTKAFLKSPTK